MAVSIALDGLGWRGVQIPVQIGERKFWLRWVMLRGGTDSFGAVGGGLGDVLAPQLLMWCSRLRRRS